MRHGTLTGSQQIAATNHVLQHHTGDFDRLRTAMASQRVRIFANRSTLILSLSTMCVRRASTSLAKLRRSSVS